ncbi:putative transposase [Trichonephila clavata]|uniref:Putative transposase n=1 Tax=Trichonephila clavata TaxID=2740835 RepID=A0A8X6FSQ4_TRICU|nr:putative transposase [Trichonephila clavata]
MKPSKLQRNLNTKHATLSKKPIEYFERLLQTSNKEKNTLEKYVTLNDKYLLASYEVSYLIAKTKKPFTIGEQLLLPAAIRMSEIVHGKQYAAEISKIPLSNDTVSKRISDISNDQFQQLLMRLKDSSKYFPNDIDTQQWICNPFSIEMEEINFLNFKAEEELAELTSDTTLRLRFSQVPVHEFWIEIKSEYPLLSEMAMNKLLPFCTTYLCESAFSTLTYIKSKYRSTLINVENLLRSAITQIEPRFNYLCTNKQSHPSH